MIASMPHKYYCGVILGIYKALFKFKIPLAVVNNIGISFYNLIVIIIKCKQWRSTHDSFKFILISFNISLHHIVLYTVYYMGRLHIHFFDAVIKHSLHSGFYIIYKNIVSFFKYCHNNLACPCPIEFDTACSFL